MLPLQFLLQCGINKKPSPSECNPQFNCNLTFLLNNNLEKMLKIQNQVSALGFHLHVAAPLSYFQQKLPQRLHRNQRTSAG